MIRMEFDQDIQVLEVEDDRPKLKEGDLYLSAREAEITGQGALQLEGGKNLGHWLSNANRAAWTFQNISPDTLYAVELVYALDPEYAGAHFRIECGSSWGSGYVPPTKGWGDYQTLQAGHIYLQDVGSAQLTLMKQGGGKALFNLKGLVLRKQASAK